MQRTPVKKSRRHRTSKKKRNVRLWPWILIAAGLTIVLLWGASLLAGSRYPSSYSDSAVARVGQQNSLSAVIPEPSATPKESPSPNPPAEYSVPVLTYHYIRDYHNPFDRIGEGLSIPPAQFKQQLDYLQTRGYHTMSFADLYYGHVPPKPVILTFDDGYKDHFTEVFPALAARHMKGTFYIVTGYVGNDQSVDWSDINVMKKAGMEIGAHTVKHVDLAIQTPENQRKEIEGSISSLEAHLKYHVLTFAYPAGKSNEESVKILREAGIPYAVKTDYGTATNRNDQLLLPRLRILPETSISQLLP